MKYKLIDVKNKVEQNVEFGTCELCTYMGTHYYDILIFQDETGQKYEVENGEWVWGDYFVYWWIDNYVEFAEFISSREYPEPTKDKYGRCEFGYVVHDMYREYEEEVEE